MFKREVTSHKANELNNSITIGVLDEPGPGGANHRYKIQTRMRGPEGRLDGPLYSETLIEFQNGPIGERGPNGITNEALLAVVIDRLECFQRGPHACKDNEDALAMLKGGLTCLHKRTKTRVAQGVEGTSAPHTEPAQVDTAAMATTPAVEGEHGPGA